jgi:hypothetical protein
MYTNLSTSRRALQLSIAALLLTIGTPRFAIGQDPPPPTRLPGMTVTATPMPGPKIMVGIVRDTSGFPIPGAEVIIPGLERRLIANDDGVFRFDGVPKGKHTMRARKMGYAPQIREFVVDSTGGIAEFELMPLARALPAMVSSSERPGITGVVGDTAYDPIPEVIVRDLGGGLHAASDSNGSFYVAAKGGSHMVRFTKPGYIDKLVSVTYPADSGRRISVWMQPKTAETPVREFHNFDDLAERVAWTKPQNRLIYTHEQLVKLGSEWVYDAVQSAASRFNAREPYSRDCMVVVNGGPAIANLSHLTVDEIETVEIYGGGSSVTRGTPRTTTLGKRGRAAATVQPAMSNRDRATIENGTRNCPMVYVWLR